MAKRKKVKGEKESAEKPVANQLKSINKQEKNKDAKNKKKSKNKLLDSILTQLKSEKKSGTIQLFDNKQNVKENGKQNLVNKQDSNQSEKKKKRKKKNKKSLGQLEASSLNDFKQNVVQENGKSKESKKKKKRKKKNKSKNVNVDNANEKPDEKKEEKQIKAKNDSKYNDKVMKRLNIDKLQKILQDEEKSKKQSKKRNTSPLSLRDRMMAQLKASRFRFLNEQLYSSESSQSKKFFQDDPQAFYAYHEGYKHQVERWPLNPLDVIIEAIMKMPKNYVIADFGCGEGKLADSVTQTVHSFDLVAVNDKVKACDMANTPLLTGRANVVVFCLSLMGSNLGDYLLEANRVLEKDGILKIAEVESRFDNVNDFIKNMANYGFVLTWKDLSHNLFYFMDFKKTKDVLKKNVKKLPALTLKPCLYKKR